MARMRLVGWNVQPVIMADDEENLTPVQVAPQMVPAAAWEGFKAGGDQQSLAKLREQIEGPGASETEEPVEAAEGAS